MSRGRYKSAHDACWDVIPWIVNGRATADQREQFESHIDACEECREELRRQQLVHAYMRGSDAVIVAPQASWQKLVEQLDQPTPARTKAPRGEQRPQRRWLVAAVWLQGILIAGLGGYVLVSTSLLAPRFETLSSDSRPAPADLRVVFTNDASVQDINALLRRLDGSIVSGPSEAGVYSIRLSPQDEKVLADKLVQLRRESIVIFAERASSASTQ